MRIFVIFEGWFCLTQLQSGHVFSLILKLSFIEWRIKKTLTRLCHEGHLVADLYHRLNEKSEFRSFSNGDSGWLSYSQNTLEVSFCRFLLNLLDQLKNFTRTLSESSICDRFLPSPDCKKPNFSHFWDLRLADTLIAATCSHRQIVAIPLVLWCIKKN